jgi:hypothetical protein
MSGFIEASGGKMTPLYLFAYSGFLFIIYLLFIKLYKVVKPGDFSMKLIETQTLDVGIVLLYGLLAFIFFPWMMYTINKAAKEQWQGLKRILLIIPFSIPIGLILLLIVFDNPSFIEFIDKPLPIFTSVYSIGVGVLLAVGCLILMKYAQKRQLKKVL